MFLSVKRLLTIWVFYRFPAKNVDDDNIFSANLAENNEIKDVSLKKGQKYMVTELSINSKHDPDVIISDLNARNSLSDMTISSEEEITKFYLDCQFYKKDLFDVATPFKNRSDVFTLGYTCFDTTTNKIQTIELYNYYNHLKDFGFKWENDLVGYEITLTENQKQIEKNLLVCVG